MEKQVALYDNHDNWKVILIDEKKVVLYNKCDGVVDVVKKVPNKHERHVKCPVCHRDMPSPPPGTVPPMADTTNPRARAVPNPNVVFSPNYFQLLWNSAGEEEGIDPNAGVGLNAGYYHRFFKEVSKIGSGGFGSVYQCRHVINGIDLGEYAIKKVPMGSNVVWQQRVFAEVQNLQRLQQHPNIIGYKHSWMEEDQPAHFGPSVPCLFILMEFANGGNLEDYINDRYLTDQEIWRIFVDLCQGLGYLHHCGILHRDIKCNNILLSNTFDAATGAQVMRVLISDFGTSADIFGAPPAKRTGNTGTVEYLAPELLVMNALGEYSPYTDKCDMWAMGVLLYKLCFGQFPYHSANLQDREIAKVLQEIANFDGLAVPRQDRDQRLIDLMFQLLSRNPLDRPSISSILHLPHVQAMIYTPPIRASSPPPPSGSSPASRRRSSPTPPPSTSSSSSSSSLSSSSLRLRRSNTASYPLLLDSPHTSPTPSRPRSASSSPPSSLPHALIAPPQPLPKLLSAFPFLFPYATFLSSSLPLSFTSMLPPFSSLLYTFISLLHLSFCFFLYGNSSPPLSLILPVVGGCLLGSSLQRERNNKMALTLVFVGQLLLQCFAIYMSPTTFPLFHVAVLGIFCACYIFL